jgi:hypothetical protein
MAKHHLLGPSSLPRIVNCVGSLYGPPVKDEAGPAAREGTACHAVLEFCMSFGANPRDLLGSTDFDKEFPVTIEMIEAVELFIDTIKGVCDEFSIPHDRIKSEERLVHGSIPDGLFGGTTDCQVFGDDVLVIADLKYGRRPVFADSIQLTAYSLLSLANAPAGPDGNPRTFRRIVQIVVQPRANPQVSRHEPGVAELDEAWNAICNAAKFVVENPDLSTPRPDAMKAGEWCKYCKRREGCPAREGMVTELVELGTFVNPNDMTRLTSPTHDISTEVLVDWMEKADVIKEFLEDVKKALIQRASQGHKVPGHKLVVSWGHRKFIGNEDPAKLERKLTRTLGLATKDVRTSSVGSPSQIEKVLKAAGTWKEVKDKFDKLTVSTPSGVKLVKEQQGGEEIRPETALEFLKTLEEKSDE